ncbi:Hypothetical predicted protein [Mytilus galloprovincialis]|uniref:Carbohydrate sulfotransferase n=1 Tax=Mytilus galloprovincialis TaxID=29158 RepID=A0A8B6BQ47_MYTGA|nr:Hypothetical predicted protein [Mytilus galloprovincialis]
MKSRKHNLDQQCYNRIDVGRSDEDNFKAHMQFVPEEKMKLDNCHNILIENSKFLFVRDPYSRLLSGYLDKIFSPSPYWFLIGSKAVEFTRKQKNHCGHDVTFPEINGGVLHTEELNKDRDGHFLPATDHCRPCVVQYNYNGKMKTFADDVRFSLKEFNLENYTSVLKDFRSDSIYDSLADSGQTFRDVLYILYIKQYINLNNELQLY